MPEDTHLNEIVSLLVGAVLPTPDDTNLKEIVFFLVETVQPNARGYEIVSLVKGAVHPTPEDTNLEETISLLVGSAHPNPRGFQDRWLLGSSSLGTKAGYPRPAANSCFSRMAGCLVLKPGSLSPASKIVVEYQSLVA